MENRRQFIKKGISFIGTLALAPETLVKTAMTKNQAAETSCALYRAVNGTPSANLGKVIETMGGIEKVIESDDIVIIKPNVQWWNQGTPNLSALRTLVDMVMERPGGFRGEVVLGENCHRGIEPWKSVHSGWTGQFERNSDVKDLMNMADVSLELKRKYGPRFSLCHWIDVEAGGKRVSGPQDGDGYVYCDGTNGNELIACHNDHTGEGSRATIMTYPIFITDKGTRIDFRYGVWERGSYTGQPLRFINFAALNHHGQR